MNEQRRLFLALAVLLSPVAANATVDTTPNQFTFKAKTDVPLNTVETSNAPKIVGINSPAPVSVTGGSYSIGCTGTFTTAPGTISNQQTVCVRQTSSSSHSTAVNTTLNIGGVTGTFTTTTIPPDTTPNPFTFVDQNGVTTNTVQTSNAVTISGIDTPSPISVSGGSYSIGCTTSFSTSAATITNGQKVCVRQTSAAAANTVVNTTLTIGGVSDTFTTITAGATPSGVYQLPFATGPGAVKLVDPTSAFSAINPLVVDAGLKTGDVAHVQPVLGATVSAGTLSSLHLHKLVYSKGSKVFVMNLEVGVRNNARNISNIADACWIVRAEGDWSNPDHSWALVQRKGADGNCGTADDVYSAVRVNTPITTAGISPAGLVKLKAVHGATGAIIGFITVEGTAPVTLTRRDVNFANPAVIMDLADNKADIIEQGFGRFFIEATASGQTAPQLFGYNGVTKVATTALYTYVNATASGITLDRAVYDGSDLYFPDGRLLERIALGATSSGHAQTVTTAAGSQTIQELALADFSATRLVFTAFDNSSNGGVFSVLKTATNGSATTLAPSGASAAQFASLVAVAPGNVYINLALINFFGDFPEALFIHDDGTGSSSSLATFWAGATIPTSLSLSANSVHALPAVSMILGTEDSSAPPNCTLQVVDASSGATGITLGTINSVVGAAPAISGFGIGRYAGLAALMQRGGGKSDSDAYFVDTQTVNSLQLVNGQVGSNDLPLGD